MALRRPAKLNLEHLKRYSVKLREMRLALPKPGDAPNVDIERGRESKIELYYKYASRLNVAIGMVSNSTNQLHRLDPLREKLLAASDKLLIMLEEACEVKALAYRDPNQSAHDTYLKLLSRERLGPEETRLLNTLEDIRNSLRYIDHWRCRNRACQAIFREPEVIPAEYATVDGHKVPISLETFICPVCMSRGVVSNGVGIDGVQRLTKIDAPSTGIELTYSVPLTLAKLLPEIKFVNTPSLTAIENSILDYEAKIEQAIQEEAMPVIEFIEREEKAAKAVQVNVSAEQSAVAV